MKQFISFKSLLLCVIILSVVILSQGCQKDFTQASVPGVGQTLTANAIARVYLDFSKDQMIVGGITDALLKKYQAQGYKVKTLDRDRFCYHVSFKDKAGKIYYRDGWVKKGSKYLEKTQGVADPIEDFWYECANLFWPYDLVDF